MEQLFQPNWSAILLPTGSILEIFIRGTLTYIALFLILRFFLKRQSGVIGIADLLVVVLIADAAQNGMTGEADSVTEGIGLVLTIVFWNYAFDWLGYRFPVLQRLIRPPPLLLVKDGQMIRRNMKEELITREELMSQLREKGIEDLAEVEKVFIEGDGRISVIKREGGELEGDDKRAPV